MYETYRELMCHFHICLDIHNICGNTNGLKSLVDYLFLNLMSIPEEIHTPVADADIEALMVVSGHDDVILEEDDRVYEKSGSFKRFHHQVHQLMACPSLLTSFLSVWLKKCVVPSLRHDVILSIVLLLVIQLVYKSALGLLLTMVCSIQHGL